MGQRREELKSLQEKYETTQDAAQLHDSQSFFATSTIDFTKKIAGMNDALKGDLRKLEQLSVRWGIGLLAALYKPI